MPPSNKDKKQHPNLRRLLNTPVCIICARSSEAEEIAQTLGSTEKLYGTEISKVNRGHTFHLGSLKLTNGKELGYYVTHTTRQGIQSFTVDAGILLYLLKPRYVIHAGVCAGYRDSDGLHKLGDVIFAEGAINYEEGKMVVVDNKLMLLPDFDKVTIPVVDMQSFAESPKHPDYHFGDFITGSAVRTDAASLFEDVRKRVGRKIIGLDMEASAFLKLCQSEYLHGINCGGVVKGISDFGDANKSTDNANAYSVALQNTAKALTAWINHHIRSDAEPRYDHEPANDLVTGYYENFIHWVVQNLDFDSKITAKGDPNFSVSAKDIKGIRVIMPPGGDPTAWKNAITIRDAMAKYGIRDVTIGTGHAHRYVYYKDGFLIDFTRNCIELLKYEDKLYQTEVFAILLGRQAHFIQHDTDTKPRATIMQWDEFKKWMDEVAKKEEEEERERKEKAENETGGAESTTQHEPEKLTQASTMKEKRKPTTPNPDVRKSHSFPHPSGPRGIKRIVETQDTSHEETPDLKETSRNRLIFRKISMPRMFGRRVNAKRAN